MCIYGNVYLLNYKELCWPPQVLCTVAKTILLPLRDLLIDSISSFPPMSLVANVADLLMNGKLIFKGLNLFDIINEQIEQTEHFIFCYRCILVGVVFFLKPRRVCVPKTGFVRPACRLSAIEK